LTPSDRDDLSLALDLASSACAAAGLPTPDEDKDLVELGRAMRGCHLAEDVAAAAGEAFRLRQLVTARNLGLAIRLAQVVSQREPLHDPDDIRQFAAMELCKAVARFRPLRSTGKGYLSYVIYKAVSRWARRHRPREVPFSAKVTEYVYGGINHRPKQFGHGLSAGVGRGGGRGGPKIQDLRTAHQRSTYALRGPIGP
jgi:hypothetical protein